MEPSERAPLKKRTTVMLSVGLLAEIDRVRAALGVSRSALVSLAAACFTAKMTPMLKPTHRADSLAAAEELFTELLAKARKAA